MLYDAAHAAAEGSEATAEGDLLRTVKEPASAGGAFGFNAQQLSKKAADHGLTAQAREEALNVIAQATDTPQKTSSGAVSQTYSLSVGVVPNVTTYNAVFSACEKAQL